MKNWQIGAAVGLLMFSLFMPMAAQAADVQEERANSEIKTDSSSTDNETKQKGALARELEKRRQANGQADGQEKKERYVYLLEDNGFIYYLDTQNVQWKNIPYSESEEILDVWIKLVKVDGDEEYSYPQKYFLEHYYLRPKKKQIQFLSELEVTGRPDNAIKERPYSVRNWENIVSGSLEDEIYHNVFRVVNKQDSKLWPKHKSVRDVLEDVFRISL